MILIIASNKDPAGMNIKNQLITLYKFEETSEIFDQNPVYEKTIINEHAKLVTMNAEPIHAQNITDRYTPELIIFISRHSSQSRIPTLSVHTPGNLTSQAEKGGTPNQVSISPASAMKEALKEMARQKEEKQLAYTVSYECTHHGPSLNTPTMFAELGSSPTQWADAEAAEAVAHATIAAAKTQTAYPAAVGIGGPHYNEKFTKIALNTQTAFGHMMPKYAIAKIDTNMLTQCIEKTAEKVESIILDWKGIRGEHKEKLVKAISATGLRMEKV